ncbi:hypothetical protein PM082_014066 [Marasmius tenuissimus]|nr:hypothetical protein PM082_014066 [Marasmius tenuissimus]
MPHSTVIAAGFFAIGYSAAVRAAVQPRADIQATAQCQSEYGWAHNEQGTSPCLVYAALAAPCLQGRYHVPPITVDYHYDPPRDAHVNRCECSWAAYNMQSACTLCQDVLKALPNTWNSYNAACGSSLTNDTYWPSDIAITGGHKIPAYAATNPADWKDQIFDPVKAQQIAQQHLPDLDGKPPPEEEKKDKKPVGAIAGGVVGGVALLAGLGILLWFVYDAGGGLPPACKSFHPLKTAPRTLTCYPAPPRTHSTPLLAIRVISLPRPHQVLHP